MESIIKKISSTLSLIVVFFIAGLFYFNFKGFAYIDGHIVYLKADAEAAVKNGIATVLPSNIVLGASQKYALGSASAPLTLYEYSSLGCPHCSDFHNDILPKLKEEYIDKGQLRVIFVNFPLDKKSMKAALLSNCLTYENYFGFLNRLFDRQRFWVLDSDDEQLVRYAAEYGLSYSEAQACMNDDSAAQDIISNRQEAITRLGIKGTPAFFFQGSDGNEIVYGVHNYDDFKKYIESRLSRM